MANLQFGSWVWEYASQSPDIQEHLEQEIIGDGWFFRQPTKEQVLILEGAPQAFIDKVLPRLKPETAIAMGINPYLRR